MTKANGFVLTIALALVLGQAPAAHCEDWFTVTKCDSVTINNHSYDRITFSLHNLSTDSPITSFTMKPHTYQVPGDTCHVIATVGPTDWLAGIRLDGGPAFRANSFEAVIEPGETQDGFQLVLSKMTCCYGAALFDFLVDPFIQIDGICFTCPMATPSRQATWGQVKVRYR